MRATVLTAIYDSYDELKPTCPQDIDVDWICVTDDASLASGAQDRRGWTIAYEPRHGVHPNRAAKTPKMLPWRYTDTPCSVWVDASYGVTSQTFVSDVLAIADPIAQFVHPWRSCIYDEADASVVLAKYDGEPILEQMPVYLAEGHPAHWGLWATGVIARWHTDDIKDFGYRWLGDNVRFSFQDQLSEPPALRAFGLRPTALPGDHMVNPWLAFRPSVRH